MKAKLKVLKIGLIISLLFPLQNLVFGQQLNLPVQTDRWQMAKDGSIFWEIKDRLPHDDHIEMSGQQVSLWLQYGVDAEKRIRLKRTVVFPGFRMKPNDTHSSLMQTIRTEELPQVFVDGKPMKDEVFNGRQLKGFSETMSMIRFNGMMEFESKIGAKGQVSLKRTLFPSVDKAMAVEKMVFVNQSDKPVKISMDHQFRDILIDTPRSHLRPQHLILKSAGGGHSMVKPGDSLTFSITYQAVFNAADVMDADVIGETAARRKRIGEISGKLQLMTPDPVLNAAFAFAKIRATESIFKTKRGPMHGPGGLSYYAAIWANDQAEYVNPFFAFLGDELGNQSAMNAYRMFATYMNPEYKPIPSSIIAEGDGFWNGAGDRGDQAMIAYGASRYALANGNIDSARKLWPLIKWCLEYSGRKLNPEGVVASQSDELEGRFPAGKANLSTSCLYYDALISAEKLSRLLGEPAAAAEEYTQQAKLLRAAIDHYFSATIDGFETYRYYDGNEVLRSWICMPLTVGIEERKAGTIQALFSPKLFTADGLLTQAGDKTFWDRSTLYALKGILEAGDTENAMLYLRYYSKRRLLGEHVPYPVEAFPEGGQRHLSAESGLYCRVFTEGLFGMRPIGFDRFSCTPRLPEGWNEMALRNIHSFGNTFDMEVSRSGSNQLKIKIKKGRKIRQYLLKSGATALVKL
ncbi:glucosidase family protein [Pedobacter caeni]|uniref:Alpha-L-rhamnosidase six-hairpin glycosidase domain-containing protein n=1 Tax=Pedobacter caeni TaxID=288992 RepID=A0A1M5JD57_9SPHI|nr:hypothetical protein [Pedobacter caeni]SHG37953.1 hypothetical protein SAMN04488522_105281 [Pedobacter caeni]